MNDEMKKKIKVTLIYLVYFVVGYMLTNHYPMRQSVTFTLLSVEKIMPFMPITVWVYITAYLFPLTVLYILRDEWVESFFRGFMFLTTLHLICFVVYPVAYPRVQVVDSSGLTAIVLGLIRYLDSPLNCFPSIHVSACFYGVMFLWTKEKKKKRNMLFLLWAILVAISTLTTKQHYLWDVVAGVLIGGCFGFVVGRWTDGSTSDV